LPTRPEGASRCWKLEGFLVVDEATYPALSRIVDFSNESSKVAARKALKLLNDDWANPPTPADQMPPAAT